MASKRTTTVLVVLACVAFGILAVCAGTAGLLVWSAREAVQFVGEELEKERERQAFAASWRPPPADVSPENLFPVEVAGFQRTSYDEVAGVPEYTLDVPGRRAEYERRAATIEVFACRANQLEAEALIRRVADAIEQRQNGYRMQVGSPESGRYHYSVRPPAETGRIWASQGWLFFLRTGDEVDLEPFLMDYLRALEGTEPATEPAIEHA